MSTSINSVNLADLITIPEAAKRTPLTEGQLRGWIDRGYIPVVRFGGRIFVTAEDLKRLLGRPVQRAHAGKRGRAAREVILSDRFEQEGQPCPASRFPGRRARR